MRARSRPACTLRSSLPVRGATTCRHRSRPPWPAGMLRARRAADPPCDPRRAEEARSRRHRIRPLRNQKCKPQPLALQTDGCSVTVPSALRIARQQGRSSGSRFNCRIRSQPHGHSSAICCAASTPPARRTPTRSPRASSPRSGTSGTTCATERRAAGAGVPPEQAEGVQEGSAGGLRIGQRAGGLPFRGRFGGRCGRCG